MKRKEALSLATNYMDADGAFVKQDERVRRVFLAATHAGMFRVTWDIHNAQRTTQDTRHFGVAVYLVVRLIEEGERPLLYAATYNSDALISARAYRDEENGRWVSRNDALADELQKYLDLWCAEFGIKNSPSPIINRLRTKKRIKRERL